jgi:tellurite resistance protein TehA-like permease
MRTTPAPSPLELSGSRPRRLLAALCSPADAFAHLGPNWFASVMGTGIVAVAATPLPVRFAGRTPLAVTAWVIAAALLVVLVAATAVHWVRHPQVARSHARDGAMAPFYGAPPMALLTVGAGELLAGLSAVLFTLLLIASATALVNTARGALNGRLLLAPGSAAIPAP